MCELVTDVCPWPPFPQTGGSQHTSQGRLARESSRCWHPQSTYNTTPSPPSPPSPPSLHPLSALLSTLRSLIPPLPSLHPPSVQVLESWLKPRPDGSLPNPRVRETLIEVFEQLPGEEKGREGANACMHGSNTATDTAATHCTHTQSNLTTCQALRVRWGELS